MQQLGQRPDALIEVLHTAQEVFGHLDTDALAYIGAALGVPLSKVYGVATFYSHFTLSPHGEHTCVVCTGTACHISGGAAILAAVRDRLGVAPGRTIADGKLSVLTTRCPGTCSLAPMVLLDGVAVGPVRTVDDVVAPLEAL
jgi:bidirectional [NiFe] hydrogenase diaphorase subunit